MYFGAATQARLEAFWQALFHTGWALHDSLRYSAADDETRRRTGMTQAERPSMEEVDAQLAGVQMMLRIEFGQSEPVRGLDACPD